MVSRMLKMKRALDAGVLAYILAEDMFVLYMLWFA